MKKLLVLMLAAAMLIGMTACSTTEAVAPAEQKEEQKEEQEAEPVLTSDMLEGKWKAQINLEELCYAMEGESLTELFM